MLRLEARLRPDEFSTVDRLSGRARRAAARARVDGQHSPVDRRRRRRRLARL